MDTAHSQEQSEDPIDDRTALAIVRALYLLLEHSDHPGGGSQFRLAMDGLWDARARLETRVASQDR